MKKYTRPTIEIVELQANQNLCAEDVNPIAAATYTDGTTVTTVYNLALMGGTSVPTNT